MSLEEKKILEARKKVLLSEKEEKESKLSTAREEAITAEEEVLEAREYVAKNASPDNMQTLAEAINRKTIADQTKNAMESEISRLESEINSLDLQLEKIAAAVVKPVEDLKALLKSLEHLGIDTSWNNLMTAQKLNYKALYRTESLKYHPDKNKSPEAAPKFLKIKDAYEQAKSYKIQDIQHALKEDAHREMHTATGFDFKGADADTQNVLGNIISDLHKAGLHL